MRRHGLKAAILAAILASGAILRADLRAAAADRDAIRQDLQSVADRVADVGERVARIEGALPFLAAAPARRDQPTR